MHKKRQKRTKITNRQHATISAYSIPKATYVRLAFQTATYPSSEKNKLLFKTHVMVSAPMIYPTQLRRPMIPSRRKHVQKSFT